jgi:hypothetical protein
MKILKGRQLDDIDNIRITTTAALKTIPLKPFPKWFCSLE